MVLHDRERRPTVLFSDMLHVHKLVPIHRGSSDGPYLADPDKPIQGFHRLFHRRVIIETMDDVKVQVIRAEAFQAALDFPLDGIL